MNLEDKRIGQLLVREGLLSESDLKKALTQQASTPNRQLGEVLMEMGLIDETQLLRVLARQFRTQYLTTKKLSELNIPDAILKLVPQSLCERYKLFPVQYKKSDKSLTLVMTDPTNVAAIDEVKFVSGIGNIKTLVGLAGAIKAMISRWYGGDRSAFGLSLEETEIQSGIDLYAPSQSRFSGEPQKAETSTPSFSEPQEEEFVDFQALVRQEEPAVKKREDDESIYLGDYLSAQPGDEGRIVIEEAQNVPSVQVEEITVQPVSQEVVPKPEAPKRVIDQKKYRLRMVVVENHDQIRKFISKLLTSEGYKVKGFKTKELALEELKIEEYDSLVIKERYIGEGAGEFEERFRRDFPNVELCIIKDYGSSMIGETRQLQRLAQGFLETLDVVLGLLEMEGHSIQGHSHTVSKYSRLLASKLDLSPKEVDTITLAASLHELGKKGLKHFTILQVDAVSDAEEIMEQAEIPLKLLGGAKFPWDIGSIIRNQYERWDGRGIPKGLKGEAIPIGARILALVDSFDDLTNKYSGREVVEPSEALELLNRQAGKIFDPTLLELFMAIVRDDIYLKQMELAKDRVLLAETEIDLATLLELRLIKEGFGVIVARDGEDALAKTKAEKPSLIISEVDLPRISGFEFISRVLEDKEINKIPFVFLSRRDDPQTVTKGLDLGAEDYITKPVKVDVLCAKIKTMMNRLKAEKKVEAPKAAGVSGSLKEMSLPDIIQILGAGRKTGLITLRKDGETAEIYLEDGRVVNAKIDDLKGEEAFYKILYWNEGTFTIDPSVEITERLINMSNDSLMLEGYRRMDEEMRDKRGEEDISMDGSDFF